jgi:hypothetical protein
MSKRYIIPFVLVFVLMSVAMVSADGNTGQYYNQNYTGGQYYYNYNNCYYPNCNYYYPVQPVARDCASFVADVTIPDGTFITPGVTFTKTWRIRNNGTTTWTTNYKLVFVSGTQMAHQSSVNLPYNVMPGQTVDISVQMTAPADAGSYKSSWMLMNESGSQFGVGANCMTPVWAQIVNYVQQYNYNYGYNNYCYGYSYNNCAPRTPCNGWYCGIPSYEFDRPHWKPQPCFW